MDKKPIQHTTKGGEHQTVKHSHKHGESAQNKKFKSTVIGLVRVNSYGTGFVDKEDKKDDEKSIEIPNNLLHTATHLDEIEIGISGRKTERGNPEGEVIKIIKKKKDKYTGVIENKAGGLVLVPDDKRLYSDINIEGDDVSKVKRGDKVHVQITHWTKDEQTPIGKILEVVGRHGEHEAEIRAILLERGIARDFDHNVEDEARKIRDAEGVASPNEIAKRRDFRKTLTFTIDPIDAKDFDDAISFVELPDGNCEIGVHIADVSHYVRPGTALDAEARERGFSVYLVDRTIPMLPEILSNDLCSLNAHEDKMAFSSVFIMNKKGVVLSRWFGKSIICSARRFSYEDAQKSIMEGGDYENELRTLNSIAKIMRAKKERDGAIDFEQDEVKFELNAQGHPIRVFRKKRFDAHKLVEEYMLLANREVAEFMSKAVSTKAAGFLYRIHDVPDEEKIAELAIFVRALGHELPISAKGVSVRDLQMLMKKVEGKAEESLVKTAAIRSMTKAIYSTDNVGHFGLAFEYYTHFTSPIRRYADLIVHRLLHRELLKEPIAKGDWATYKKIAAETSEKEIRAAEAERASIKYKQVEFMKERIGQTFAGSISGVTEWGIYVEDTETRSEGMIRLKDLPGDFYAVDKKKYAVVGQRTKKVYRLGDKVKFKILKADLERKTLDFTLVE